jgi:hypothetical protein
MNKVLFSESQIKQIIEKTNQVATKNNGSIPISSIEDAAALAAYVAGYSSWKQYRKEQKKLEKIEFKSHLENQIVKQFDTSSVDISPTAILELKEQLKKISSPIQSITLQENKQLLYKIEVGQMYDRVTKATQLCYLNLENTCFIGENTNFLKIAQNSLIEQSQTIIEFNQNNKSGDKLNPIEEIFSGDYLEEFLSNGNQDSKNFNFIWGLLIKQLSEQYKVKFTADFLIETLDLGFVMKAWCMLYQEGNFLANMIMNYIKALPQIKIEPSKVTLSGTTQESHWENIKGIYNELSELKDAYDKNIFSYTGIKLLDCMTKKQSVEISIPLKTEKFLIKVIEFIIGSTNQSYQKQVEGLDVKEHAIFVINKHENLNPIINENSHIFNFTQLAPWASSNIKDYEQILFSKHNSFMQPSNDFITKFYLSTSNLEKNLFANSGEALIKLEDNISYLWKRENKEASIGSFIMQRIAH